MYVALHPHCYLYGEGETPEDAFADLRVNSRDARADIDTDSYREIKFYKCTATQLMVEQKFVVSED